MKLPVTFAIELDVRNALDEIAAAEERSRSWVAERMLRQCLAAREMLPPALSAELAE